MRRQDGHYARVPVCKAKRISTPNDFFIDQKDLWLLLVLLRDYFELNVTYTCCGLIRGWFNFALLELKTWCAEFAVPQRTFAEMDLDLPGQVLFDAFCDCDWASF